MDLGKYKATGIPGGIAMARHLDTLVSGIKSPVTSSRGLAARLKYLMEKKGGAEAMARAGITVKPDTIKNWVDQKTTPRAGNLAKIDAAYWDLKRRNSAPRFKAKLDNAGAGNRIEIYPVDQSHVEQKHRRAIEVRQITVRGIWDDFVEAWMQGDEPALDVIWDEVLNQLGSDYDAYTYVTHVGFGFR
ncbi:transcriptional regulator [Kitasatospora sp. NPDC086791]|uniref:transcriptional regulator n=1 Tax=Kitasatospora sp. NPDC086791 TaxID=3155178 RepID=UPI0034262CE4